MKLPTYWPYLIYFLAGVVLLLVDTPAWMIIPLACACIGGALDNNARNK